MITILTSLVRLLSADDVRESGEGVECKLYIIIIIINHHHRLLRFYMIVLYILCFKINTLLCYTVVSVLVVGIGGQYYWILGALFGIVLTLSLTQSYQVTQIFLFTYILTYSFLCNRTYFV